MIIHRHHFKSIDSTHTYLMHKGDELPHGTLITADFQERGRGRLDRTWSASPGSSLLASLLLKPAITAERVPQLTHVMALACARVLQNEGLAVAIRWPNDIICSGKKIAGILAEASLTGDNVQFAVLSVGINLNQTAEELAAIDRPATSCALETGRPWNVDVVVQALTVELEALYTTFLAGGFPALKQEWESLNALKEMSVTLDLGTRTAEGTVEGIDDEGALLLGTAEGTRSFSAGEVVRVSGETQ